MLRVIYKKNRTEPAVFFQNRTETEPNLKNPFRTSLATGTATACISRLNLIFESVLCRDVKIDVLRLRY